jgi:hypothetical protein
VHRAPTPVTVSRRAALLLPTLAAVVAAAPRPARAAAAEERGGEEDDEARAYAAYSERDFDTAERALTRLIDDASAARSPGDRARLLEMRAAARVDNKRFPGALSDYEAALEAQSEAAGRAAAAASSGSAAAASSSSSSRAPPAAADGYDLAYAPPTARARLLAGRALAREGVSDWRRALDDYDAAAALAAADGARPDPYIANSRGNCLASLGRWADARAAYLEAAELFQRASGFRGRGGSTTARLDGAIFASSNAALALAQLGDEAGATREAERVARRAPGSADMRAALAALYWHQGRRADAEGSWEFVCSSISVGCSKYRDAAWLSTVRRWPPVMVERMSAFLALVG